MIPSWIRRRILDQFCIRALRWLSLAPLILSVCLAEASVAWADRDPSEVRQALDRTFADGDYQLDLPPREEEFQLPDFFNFELPPIVVEIIKILFWILLAVGIVLLAAYVARNIPAMRQRLQRARPGGKTIIPGSALPIDQSAAMDALLVADRLAREGSYGEALHHLLFHCLDLLRQWLGASIARSLTGREIVQQAGLADLARAPLEAIVAESELGHFGGRFVDEPTYRRCRELFEQFVAAGRVRQS
jgi:hypothetical protein